MVSYFWDVVFRGKGDIIYICFITKFAKILLTINNVHLCVNIIFL
jgi:hypothetical protein